MDYIKRYMGAPANIDVEGLRAEVEQLRADKAALEATVKELNSKVRKGCFPFEFLTLITIVFVCSLTASDGTG